MNSNLIPEIHHHFLSYLGLEHNYREIIQEFNSFHNLDDVAPQEFINYLSETGQAISLSYIIQRIKEEEFSRYIQSIDFPLLIIDCEGEIKTPIFIAFDEKTGERWGVRIGDEFKTRIALEDIQMNKKQWYAPESNTGAAGILVITAYFAQTQTEEENKLRPVKSMLEKVSSVRRLFQILALERTEIFHLYIYAIIAGIISLSLPLGIQSIIGFITSGQVTTSVIILIIFILIGTLITGGLSVIQLRLVEQIQRRIFTRFAFNFSYRIPKLDPNYLHNKYYPPELINRFFDLPTIQKGLAKILMDFTAALLQIVFGIVLLSFYHPYFIALGVILVVIIFLIFYLTGPKGLKSSIRESDYKYKVVSWFEEMAKSLSTFKASGYSRLPTDRTDDFLSGYLHAREQHFRVLITQYYSFVGFKTIVTGGLLILGAVLVINRQINIGQFVASEIIIILIISSVEKIMGNLDVVYDVLTGLTKVGKVMDMPIRVESGINYMDKNKSLGIDLNIKNLKFKYKGSDKPIIKNLNLHIKPNERVCITGSYSSGKSTLMRLILGYYDEFDGVISYDNVSIREYNKNSFYKRTGDNILRKDLFEGSILDNITMGDTFVDIIKVYEAVRISGLKEYVDMLPQGIHTQLVGGRLWLKETIADKIILARAIVNEPELLVLNEIQLVFNQEERQELMSSFVDPVYPWTLVVISKDPHIMKMFPRIIMFEDGEVRFDGSYAQLKEIKDIDLNQL